jgi:hypothetical protein
VVGQGVEQGVGSRVVGLAGVADQAGGGGEQDEQIQVGGPRPGVLVQQDGSLRLRGKDQTEALFVLLFHDRVVEHSGRMDDAPQWSIGSV